MMTAEKRSTLIYPALIFLAVAAAYGLSIRNGFVWDDGTFIVNNAFVHDLSRWRQYFTNAESISSEPGMSMMYRPLQTLSFALDARIWGSWAGGFHITSLLLHIASCIAIIFAFRSLAGLKPSLAAACVFAVHPALSEGVLSLASRGNQLYTLFGLIALGFFLRVKRPLDVRHCLSLSAFAAALFSKEPAIAIVALLPVVQAASGKPWNVRERWKTVMLYIPYLIVAGGYLAARAAVVDTSRPRAYWGGSLFSTLQMQAKVFVLYLRLLLWPFNLQGRYAVITPAPFPDLLVTGAVIINIALLALAIVAFRRGPKGRLLALGIAWFYISLSPVANLIPIPGSMMGERFIYFTFAGLIPLLAGSMEGMDWRRFGKALSVCAAGLAIVWILTDISRTMVWKDNGTFFALLSRQVPDDLAVQVFTASEELSSHDAASALARMERLVNQEKAVPGPPNAKLHYWYGRALLASDRPGSAYREFAVVSNQMPSREVASYLAEAAARSGDLGNARIILDREVASHPDDDAAWNGLGNISLLSGDLAGAKSAYQRALAINAANDEAAMNLKALNSK
jgi:hypothetical protein